MLDAPSPLFTLFAFIAVLGPLVVVHEMGHYLIGRWCGIRADVFAIGFGREILGWTDKRGTRWKIGWLPFGGYVQFAGDADAMSSPQEGAAKTPGTFAAASVWQRTITIFGGPLSNFLFAILILSAFAYGYGQPHTPPVAQQVMEGSAAASAGIRPGDRIVAIDGRAIERFDEIPMAVAHRPGELLTLSVVRDGTLHKIMLRPRTVTEEDRFGNKYDRAIIGILQGRPVIRPVSLLEAPLVGAKSAWSITRQMGEVVGQLVMGRRSIEDLGGPLKIAKASGEQASLGWQSYVLFVAMISLNLGLMNLLPLPVLDGGHLLFNAVEAVMRRPVSIAMQQTAYKFGFLMILALMVAVTFNDLSSFGLWQRLASLIG